jgi:toxin ParE1/3/4
MPRIVRTQLAESDYREIWRYIAKDNPDAGDRLLRRIDEQLALYAQHPGMGRARPELGARLRSFVVGNYVVFYRPTDDGIELIRVLHGARRLGPLLRQRPAQGGD